MKALQQLYRSFQEEMGWDETDKENYQASKEHLLYIHMLLTTEVAEVAEEFRTILDKTYELTKAGMDQDAAYALAKQEVRENLGRELADCLAYLCNLANFFEYDLEEELQAKISLIRARHGKMKV